MCDVEKDGSVSKEAVKILGSSIQEVVQQLKLLDAVKEPDKEENHMVIYPEKR
jgi:hypothetical protein